MDWDWRDGVIDYFDWRDFVLCGALTGCALVSVIVPVYKVEVYLSQCVESILASTYRDIEVLLINDCSPDNCGAICDEFAKRDNRVRVINHEKNRGIAIARETGTLAASGEYIMFVDSDDHIAPNMIEILVNKAVEKGADIVQSGGKYTTFVWGKLFSGAIIKRYYVDMNCIPHNEFNIPVYHDDVLITLYCRLGAKIIVTIDDELYFYRIHNESITRAKFKANRESVHVVLVNGVRRIYEIFGVFEQHKKDFDKYEYIDAASTAKNILFYPISKKEKIQKIKALRSKLRPCRHEFRGLRARVFMVLFKHNLIWLMVTIGGAK